MSEALSSGGSLLDHFLDYGFDVELLTDTANFHATGKRESVDLPHWVSPSYADLMLEIGGSLVPKILFEDITIHGIIGRGFTWTVHRGIWNDKGNKNPVAIKFLNIDIDTDDTQHSTWDDRSKHAFTAAESEIRILSHKTIRSNQNIVTLMGISFQVRAIGSSRESLALPVLVEELAFLTPDGQPATLSEYIKTNPIGANPALKMMFLLDIARGLLDLHQLNIVHADLKPSNVLLFPHSSGRTVAKISDFGFCQSIDVENPAQGSTPYWAAPEALPEAGEDLKPWRNSTNRDLFSFGLLIWYLLFEEGPFGDEENFDYAAMAREKFEESMKEKIDKQLHFSYRFHSQDPILLEGSWLPKRLFQVMTDGTQQQVELELKSLSGQIVNGSIQEQFRKPGKDWEEVKSFANGYAILQVIHFFLSFFLVKDPPLRLGLDFFLEMTGSKNRIFHEIAMANFIGLSTYDHLWQTLFTPAKRRLLIDKNDGIFRQGNFLHLMTKLCVASLNRDHNINSTLQKEHKLSMSTYFSRPVLFNIESFQNAPPFVPVKIFESLIAKANSTPSGVTFLQVGSCYWSGFGTAKSVPDALEWLLKSSNAGERRAQQIILSHFTPDQLPEELKYGKLVDWFWGLISPPYVTTSSEPSPEDRRDPTPPNPLNLEKCLAGTLAYFLDGADLSTFTALKVEYDGIFELGEQFAWTQPEYEATLKENLSLVTVTTGGLSLWEKLDVVEGKSACHVLV